MSNFKIGDKVSFVIVNSKSNGGITMRSREGKIEAINEQVAAIKYRGRIYNANTKDIRHARQKNALTEALMKSAS